MIWFVLAYLVVGYLWARLFVALVLDDGKWVDTGETIGAFGLIAATLFWPVMVVVTILFVTVNYLYNQRRGAFVTWVKSLRIKNFVRSLYGVKP